MRAFTIRLSAMALGAGALAVAALLAAGCDAKGEVAQAAAGAVLEQDPPLPPSAASPTTESAARTVAPPGGSGPEVAAPDAPVAAHPPQASAEPDTSARPRDAGAALQAAMDQDKHLFLAFYRPDDPKNDELMKTFEEAEKSLGDRALFYAANIQEEKERRMVVEYQVARAPLPLTLVFASNGAFVNAFRGKPATRSELDGSFLSPKFSEAVKALQDRKIVLLCVQGKHTQHNSESLSAARATSQAKEANGMISVVEVAPEDAASKDLLAQLRVDPVRMAEATVFVLVPPANLAGKIEGATTKDALWQTVLKGAAACGGGSCCGSGAATR